MKFNYLFKSVIPIHPRPGRVFAWCICLGVSADFFSILISVVAKTLNDPKMKEFDVTPKRTDVL